MRLVRLVVAGLALGAAIGFLGALLRPRHVRSAASGTDLDDHPHALPEADRRRRDHLEPDGPDDGGSRRELRVDAPALTRLAGSC